MDRASREKIRSPVQRTTFGARVILAVYGLTAAAISVWILLNIEWPRQPPAGSIGVVAILLAVAVPLVVLSRLGRIPPPAGAHLTLS